MSLDRLRHLAGQEFPHKELYENKHELEEMVDVADVDAFQLTRMLDAAKRGLGLANRLTGPSKKEHMSRVLSNLNRIRAALKRAIEAQDEDLTVGMEPSGVDSGVEPAGEPELRGLENELRPGAKAPGT